MIIFTITPYLVIIVFNFLTTNRTYFFVCHGCLPKIYQKSSFKKPSEFFENYVFSIFISILIVEIVTMIAKILLPTMYGFMLGPKSLCVLKDSRKTIAIRRKLIIMRRSVLLTLIIPTT